MGSINLNSHIHGKENRSQSIHFWMHMESFYKHSPLDEQGVLFQTMSLNIYIPINTELFLQEFILKGIHVAFL